MPGSFPLTFLFRGSPGSAEVQWHCNDSVTCTSGSLLWKWMIQIGKAGPLQSFELIHCIFKRDREQIWSKQTLQPAVSACSEADFPRLECSAELCPAARGCRCFCCFLWGSGQLCLEPTSVFHHQHSAQCSLQQHGTQERAGIRW